MKRCLLLLAACLGPTFAELPQMSDEIEWLGYFAGWEEKKYDFGVSADGIALIHPKKEGKRMGNREIKLNYVIEEEINGKWVRRSILEEEGLSSKNEKGLEQKKPIAFAMTVTGDTKVEWTHVHSRGAFAVMPKVLEKKTENKIRVGIEFVLPRLYNFKKPLEGRELKKRIGGDYVRGTRLNDGKKIRVKFSDLDVDINEEKFLKDGAGAIEIKSAGIGGRTFLVENGAKNSGRIDVVTRGALYKSFRILWMAETEKLGEKETYVTFEVE